MGVLCQSTPREQSPLPGVPSVASLKTLLTEAVAGSLLKLTMADKLTSLISNLNNVSTNTNNVSRGGCVRRPSDAHLLHRNLQATQIKKATDSVFWGHLNCKIPWHS